jgi:hypothetical protein
MSNRRIRKKQAARDELAHFGAGKPYSPHTVVVEVPCPTCAAPTLQRTYIPALGTLNGAVRCGKCGFEDSYLASLANVMSETDPLPEYMTPPKGILAVNHPERREVAEQSKWEVRVTRFRALMRGLQWFMQSFPSVLRAQLRLLRLRLVRPRRLRPVHRRMLSVVGDV